MVGEKEEIGQRLIGRRKRWRLVRGWLVGKKEEIGQRLWYRRKGGDWSEARW